MKILNQSNANIAILYKYFYFYHYKVMFREKLYISNKLSILNFNRCA